MFVSFKELGYAALILSAVVSAKAEGWSGLRIANAVAGNCLQIEINGQPWEPRGMGAGEVSALRRLKPGWHRLSFACDGHGFHEVRLSLKAGECLNLVPHSQKGQQPVQMKIQVLKLEAVELQAARSMTVIDLGWKPRRLLEIKPWGASWSPMLLRRLELQRIPIQQHRGYLPLRVGQKRLASMPVFEEGHHVLVLYENVEGQVACLSFRDRPWPQPDHAKP